MTTVPTLDDLADIVTPETLPEFFVLLHSRPKPHDAEYEVLILKEVAETLGSTLWKLFLSYQEQIGEKLPALTEKAWARTYPAFYSCSMFIQKKGIVIDFPTDRIKAKSRGKKSIIPSRYKRGEIVNNVIRLRNSG